MSTVWYMETLGKTKLSGKHCRLTKHFVLLVYLCLESHNIDNALSSGNARENGFSRNDLAKAFWPDASNAKQNLTVALSTIKKTYGIQLARDKQRLFMPEGLSVDVFLLNRALEEKNWPDVKGTYDVFLQGLQLNAYGNEVQTWVIEVRDKLIEAVWNLCIELAMNPSVKSPSLLDGYELTKTLIPEDLIDKNSDLGVINEKLIQTAKTKYPQVLLSFQSDSLPKKQQPKRMNSELTSPEMIKEVKNLESKLLRKLDELSQDLLNTQQQKAKGFKDNSPLLTSNTTLLKAQDLLASMPLTKLPAKEQRFAAGSLMRFSRNPNFVGRKKELLKLAGILKQGKNVAITATGIGGVGKTQLASEFTHYFGRYFLGGVFWLNFSEPSRIPDEIIACGSTAALDLFPKGVALSIEDKLGYVSAYWQNDLPKLIVFDNCEDPILLAKWQPRIGAARILVTSRRTHWPVDMLIRQLVIDVLRRPESIKLLKKYRPDLKKDQLNELAAELGDLPLALSLAGNYLHKYRFDSIGEISTYLAELKISLIEHSSLQGLNFSYSPTKHDLNIARTFAISYKQLDAKNKTTEGALKLLANAAYFAPNEPIPRELLLATLRQNELGLKLKKNTEADAILLLLDLGLLEHAGSGRLKIHNLVASFVRTVQQTATAQRIVEETFVAKAEQQNDSGFPAEISKWQAHLRFVTDASINLSDLLTARLCQQLGVHLSHVFDLDVAVYYLQKANLIFEELLGESSEALASVLEDIASLYHSKRELDLSVAYMQRSKKMYEAIFGVNHMRVAVTASNLGVILHAKGDLVKAELYFRESLAFYEDKEDNRFMTQTLNNLAIIYKDKGDTSTALEYLSKAFEIEQRLLGDDHIQIAVTSNNLGTLLQEQGELDEGLRYLEKALKIREKHLGKNHPLVANSLNNISALLSDQGKFKEALDYLEKALKIQELSLGKDHPETAISLSNMGMLYKDLEKYEQAKPYFVMALKVFEEAFGGEHPNTAVVRFNLAETLSNLQQIEDARLYFEQALPVFDAVFGSSHKKTIKCREVLKSLDLLNKA